LKGIKLRLPNKVPVDEAIICVRVFGCFDRPYFGHWFIYPKIKLNTIFDVEEKSVFLNYIGVQLDIILRQKKHEGCEESRKFRISKSKTPPRILVRQYIECWDIPRDDPIIARHVLIKWLRASLDHAISWSAGKKLLLNEQRLRALFEEGVERFWNEDDPEFPGAPYFPFDPGIRFSAEELKKRRWM
jgi:hypothetical protein